MPTIESNFNSDSENWGAVGDTSAIVYQASGGNDGGFFQVDDAATGAFWFFSAPDKFLGDKTAFIGGTLEFDLKQFSSNSPTSSPTEDISVSGGGLTIVYTFPVETDVPSQTEWTHYSLQINDTAGWKLGDIHGPDVTEEQVLTVLSNVTEFLIRGEFQRGPDSAGIDNVVLSTFADGNTPPVAADDSFNGLEDTALTGNVLTSSGEDTDADGDSLNVTALNGDAALIGVPTPLASGALLTLNSDGSFTYNSNGALDFLDHAQPFSETFSYSISDGNGGTDEATVTLNVTGNNDQPVIIVVPTITDREGNAGSPDIVTVQLADLIISATDVDQGETPVLNNDSLHVAFAAGSHIIDTSLITNNGDGSFSYNRADFDSLGEGQSAVFVISYTVTSGNDVPPQELFLTISGNNDDPVAIDDSFIVQQDTPLLGNVLANNGAGADYDPDGNPLTVIDDTYTTAQGGTVTIAADGAFTYIPPENYSGADSFYYTLLDNSFGEASGTVNFLVTSNNQAPTAVTLTNIIPGIPADADTTNLIEVASITITDDIYTGSSGNELALIGDDRALFEIIDNVLFLRAGADLSTAGATLDVAVTVDDPSVGGTPDATSTLLAIPISSANTAPTAVADTINGIGEDDGGTDITAVLLGNDTDPDNDPLEVVAIDSTGTSGLVTLVGGVVSYNPNGAFENLAVGQFATTTFTYTVSDGELTSIATATVTISGANDEPLITITTPASDVEGDTGTSDVVTLDIASLISASDVDDGETPELDNATIIISSTAFNSSLVTDNGDGTISYDRADFDFLADGQVAVFSVDFEIVSGIDHVAQNFILSIDGVNDAPVLTGDLRSSVFQGSGRTITSSDLGFTDVDDDAAGVTFTVSSLVNGRITVDGVTQNSFTGEELLNNLVVFGHNGNPFSRRASFEVVVEDGNEDGSVPVTQNFSLFVIPRNHNPIARDDDFTAEQGETVTGNVLDDNGHGADFDPDGDALIVRPETFTTALGGVVHISLNGSFSYVPAPGFVGTDSFDYTLLDDDGGEEEGGRGHDIGSVTVEITAVENVAPVAVDDSFSGVEDNPITGNVLSDNGAGADSDADGDSLAVVPGTFVTTHGGTVVVTAEGAFTYNPASNFFGTDSFDYTLVDGNGGADTGSVTFQVAPVNDAPVLTGDLGATVEQGGAVILSAADLGFTDIDDDASGVNFTVSALGTNQILIDGIAVTTFTAEQLFDGQVAFQHDGGNAEPASFEVVVEDGNEDGSDPVAQTFNLTVTPIAEEPLVYVGDNEDNNVTGTSYDDSLRGLGGDDTLFGEGGDDLIFGGDGMDHLWGGSGNDRINGGAGDDHIYGEEGNDRLWGKDGDDFISGGAGVDLLNGGAGNDDLNGGTGDDRLWGDGPRDAGGSDTFIFDTNWGNDRVMDFEQGEDVLDFTSLNISDADLTFGTNSQGDVTISFEDNTVTLNNFEGTLNSEDVLTNDDFILL